MTSKSDQEQFKVNDFVWAKLLGYPPWPGIVMEPDPEAPRKPQGDCMHWIYFFGSHNYSWIEESGLKSYEEYEEHYKAMYKRQDFKRAVNEIDEIIEKMHQNPQYKIHFIQYISKNRKINLKTHKRFNTNTPSKKRSIKDKTPVYQKKSRSSMSSGGEEIDAFMPLNKTNDGTNRNTTATPRKTIKPSQKNFGILAGNIYTSGIIKNLLETGHRLNIWYTNDVVEEELKDIIAEHEDQQKKKNYDKFLNILPNAKDVVLKSEIIFSCQANPDTSKYIISQLGDSLYGKKYVEMSSMGPETSMDLLLLIEGKNGIYLEAMMQGGRSAAFNGSLIIFAAGSLELYNECESCFDAISEMFYFLTKTNSATKLHSILQVLRGIFLTGLTECFALADKCGLSMKVFHEMFSKTDISSRYLTDKLDIIMDNRYTDTEEPLQQLQTDLSQGLELSNTFNQTMPLAAYSNESLKHARRLGYGAQDSSCVFIRTRH